MVRATNAFEQAALRPLFLLNGGALVVYLGLFGTLGRPNVARQALDWSLGKYAAIAWTAALAHATLAAYCGVRSQFGFRKQRGTEATVEEVRLGISDKAEANRFRRGMIGAGLVSFVLFLIGVWIAFASIQH
ncbi:MAG TPA: hypothetical protein VKP89_01735 [Burkholderiales bacterium]|nr:hypothetical protein [Burkholderiales bacterium]